MTGGECIRGRLYHIRKQPCDESAKSRKDERSKNNEDKAHCDFRRKNIALRPAGHPPGISPLRGEDEDHDKWRDECEIIEGEQRERTPRARLTYRQWGQSPKLFLSKGVSLSLQDRELGFRSCRRCTQARWPARNCFG